MSGEGDKTVFDWERERERRRTTTSSSSMSEPLLDIISKGPEHVLEALSPPPVPPSTVQSPDGRRRSTDDASVSGTPSPSSAPPLRSRVHRLRFALTELEIENERLRDELLAIKARAVDEKQELEDHFEMVVSERDRLRLEHRVLSSDVHQLQSQLKKKAAAAAAASAAAAAASAAASASTPTAQSTTTTDGLRVVTTPPLPPSDSSVVVSPSTTMSVSSPSSAASADPDALMFREVDRMRETLSRMTNERDRALAHKHLLEEKNAQLSAEVRALKDAALASVGATEQDVKEAAAFPVTPPGHDGDAMSPANNVVYLQQLLIASKLRLAEVLGEHDVLRTKVHRFESMLVNSKYELAQAKAIAEDRMDLVLVLRQQLASGGRGGDGASSRSGSAATKGPGAGSPPPVPRKSGGTTGPTSSSGSSRSTSAAGGSHHGGSPDSTKSSGSSSWLPLRLFGTRKS